MNMIIFDWLKRILLHTSNNKNLQKVVEGFKHDFLIIRSKGFIPSNRSHNTGIGKTFEDAMNIAENNNSLADYKGILEIKAKRELSGSMLTLFTKSPSYPEGVNSYLRERYGHAEKNGLKVLHTTISATKYNTFFNKYSFKLEIDETQKKVFIFVKDVTSGKVIDNAIYYTFDDLKRSIAEKCENIAFVNAESKIQKNKEYFFFKDATLLSGLTFQRFLESMHKGLIVYDIRLGVYRSGRNKGKSHDHGSGFRIFTKNIPAVFHVENI